MTAWVTGVATTPFAKLQDADETALVRQVVDEALADAGVEPAQIDAVFVGNVFGARGLGQLVLRASPLVGKPIINVENACASASTALLEGIAWLEGRLADRVLVIGVEVLTGRFGGLLPVGAGDPYTQQGMTLPALYALKARHHMERFGTTVEQFAAVAVKNRAHGALNPNARFRTPVSLEEVLASRPVAEPLTLLQCCPNSDGAAAAVVVREDVVGGATMPIRIAGSALASGRPRAAVQWDETTMRDTALTAYRRAGLGSAAIDVAEVHDAFTPGELLAYERLGFSGEGKGGSDLEAGRFTFRGDGPVVNPSGGLLARGHPPGATGLAQIHEIVLQLRGAAGARQVPAASVGMTVTMGGSVPQLETNACAVHILSVT
jgi:acetyl-CoA acetyltransferase